jgi:hypothetical protein
VTPSTSMSLRHSHQFKHVAARIFEVNASAAIATSPNPHAGGGGVMQGLIRFRQRRVLLPNHDTIRPIGRTNCKWPPLGKSFHIRTGLSRGERGLGETHPDWDFGCNGVSEIDVLRALQRSLMTCQRSTLSAAMLADENIAQLTKRQAVDKTTRLPDLPVAMPNLLPPSEQAFLILFPLVNRVSRRIMRTKGRKTAEAGRAHEFGPPS